MTADKFNIFSFTGKMKILHLSWMVFFVTFVVWFNMAPLKQVIMGDMGLSLEEWKTLLILNVALTIPARVIIGALTDKYGPRLVYSSLLAICSVPCFLFAFASDFTQMAIARFALGFIGAGFVIGIRMVSEWFPPRELGTAEGICGGSLHLTYTGCSIWWRRRLALCSSNYRYPVCYFQCDLLHQRHRYP